MRARAIKLLLLLVPLASLVGGAGVGCAAVLGFEDTKVRGDEVLDAAPAEDVFVPDSSDASPGKLTAEPTAIVIRRGASIEVKITLDRGSNLRGPFTARIDKLPQGVTASSATIAEAASSASISVTAAGSATLGQTDVELALDPPSLAPTPLSLLVADDPGGRDETFADKGEAADATRGATSTYYALARQADGKIVAAGIAGAAGWLVRRLAPDGATDTAFTTAAAGLPATGEIRGVAIDATGRIVLAGTSTPETGPAALTVARLTPSGALDPTFGGTGVVRATFSDLALGSSGTGVVVLANGSVVAVGLRRDILEDEAIAMRLKADGQRDTDFGTNGSVSLKKTTLTSILTEGDGAIVLCGTSQSGPLSNYFLSRRSATGAPDMGFGQSGVATFGLGYRGLGCARAAEGSYVVVGDSLQSGNTYTGGRTSSTGAQVWVRGFATGPGAGFRAVAVQPDGRIVATGHTSPPNGEARVDRILADSGPDPTFGDAGAVFIEPRGSANGVEVSLFAAALQPDGRILLAGNRSGGGAVVYRLWP